MYYTIQRRTYKCVDAAEGITRMAPLRMSHKQKTSAAKGVQSAEQIYVSTCPRVLPSCNMDSPR